MPPSFALDLQSLTPNVVPPQSQTTAQSGFDKQITISTGEDWTDTGIELSPGNVLDVTVADEARRSTDAQRACASTSSNDLRVHSSAPDALVAKLAANAQPFPVTSSRNITITEKGHLYLAPNVKDNCQHQIKVEVHTGPATSLLIKNKLSNAAQIWMQGQFGAGAGRTSAGTTSANNAETVDRTATGAFNIPSLPIDRSLRQEIDRLPHRVSDQFNNPGDMVNFVIIGSEQQLENALAAANWHLADTSNSDAITKAIEMTRHNQDYVQMPMSLLYLFGRVQDFGYEQAEAFAVVASRHHFRVWKAPFQYKGRPVWAGAGTHDIGFEKDQRNGSITHKIDPAVDGERQNIGESLEKTGLVAALTSYLPAHPVQTAHNATGGEYHSDGRILVITLK
ncbi:MAG: LssY C-terminal domain-containing protein [Acidobacteria bacterium]|nr:LssY C-terminal domain-containing protein [Acidobacteriota bacterium]